MLRRPGNSQLSQTASGAFQASRKTTKIIVGAIKEVCHFNVEVDEETMRLAGTKDHKRKETKDKEKSELP